MKYIFIIHSHTLFLSSLGVINKLGIDKKDVIFLFHRHYKTIIPFDYKWIDISEEFERTYYILFSWSRKHFFYNKKTRNEVVGFFDKLIEDNAPNGYNLYSSHLQAFGYQILATNGRCKECFFVQEGGRIMTSVLTDRISFVWKLYNKLVLRNENRLWKCTNWYPSKDTPYNRRVTVYAFDGDYFGYVYPKDNIHIDWPKIDIDVNIDPSCPMFLLDVNGLISNGKQFDLDITLPEDNRDVIYGKIKNMFKEPIKDAVVKLIEIDFGKDGRKKRIPISHTFTDKYGAFVFGPLCPGREYAIDIWVNDVRHYNLDVKCKQGGDCLRGKKSEHCEPRCEQC